MFSCTRIFFGTFLIFLSLHSFLSGFTTPVWSPPEIISGVTPAPASPPIVKPDFNGGFAATWVIDSNVQYAELPLFGNWTAPITIATNAVFTGVFNTNPFAFDIGLNGDAAIIWVDSTSGILLASKKPLGQSWNPPTPISDPPVTAAANMPAIAVSNNGDTVAIWSFFNGSRQLIYASYSLQGSFVWSAPVNVTPLGPPDPNIVDLFLKIAVDSFGNFTAIWEHFTGPGEEVQSAVFSTNTLTWSAPVSVSVNAPSILNSRLVVDLVGNATVIWVDSIGSNDNIFASQRPLLGSWSSPILISVNDSPNAQPSLAVDGTGKVTGIWTHGPLFLNNEVVYSETLAGTGIWSAPAIITPSGGSGNTETSLASNFAGDLLAMWGGPGTSQNVNVAKKPATSPSWLTPNQIDTTFIDTAAPSFITAVSPEGATVVTWKRQLPLNEGVEVASVCYSLIPPPTILSLSPNSGTYLGGTAVTITGLNFTGTTAVLFDGTPALSFVFNDDTSITAISPPHAPGPVDVTVTTPMGISNPGVFTYIGPPIITNLVPNFDSTLGGTTVIINGDNFTGATAVLFGGIPALSYLINNDNTITAISPPHAAGQVSVTVTTPIDTSNPAIFTYILPPIITNLTPNFGSTFGGTTVIITGDNFTGATAVLIGGIPVLSFIVNDDQTITAVTPAHPLGSVSVQVTTLVGTSSDNPFSIFTYIPSPHIAKVIPNHAPPTGDTRVAIIGNGFLGTSLVLFGNTPALSFEVVSDNLIYAIVPPLKEKQIFIILLSPLGFSNPFSFNIRLPIQHPRKLKGFQIENKFATQTDIINVLQWKEPKIGISPKKYLIFRNAFLKHPIGAVYNHQNLIFEDHNRKENKKYTYYIVAVDNEGNYSDPAKVTIN